MVNTLQIYAILMKKQVKNAKTLDFVNNLEVLLITSTLNVFIYGVYRNIYMGYI